MWYVYSLQRIQNSELSIALERNLWEQNVWKKVQ